MKRTTLAAIILTAISMSDFAYSGTYVTAGGGYVVPSQNPGLTVNSHNTFFTPTPAGAGFYNLPSVNWKNTLNNGYELFLAAGLNVSQKFRGEGELLFMSMQRTASGAYNFQQVTPVGGDVIAAQQGNVISRTTSTLYSYSLLANLYYDFMNSTRWTPYVGIGAGIGRVHAAGTTGNNSLFINDVTSSVTYTAPTIEHAPALNSIVFVWQLKGGVNYAITPKISVGAQYRMFRTSSYNINSGNITVNPGTPGAGVFSTRSRSVNGLLNNSLDFTVRYNFG